mgnify:CR=1 FL=1
MKPYLFKAIPFLLILLGLDAVLFVFSFELGNTFPPQERTLLSHHLKTQGVILGTSHAEQGIVPSVLKESTGLDWYNFGRARRNLVFNRHYSEAMWDAGLKPKMVVLVATYHDWNEGTHSYMIRNFLKSGEATPLLMDFILDRHLLNPRTWLLSDQYSSTHRMMFSRTLSWLKNRNVELPFSAHQENGFGGSSKTLEPKPQPKSFDLYPWKVKKLNLQAFIQTLDFWTSHQVSIVVVDPPEYLGSRLSHGDYELYRQTVSELCRERGVPYKSFSEPGQPIVEDPSLFRDGDWGHPNSHLNTRGAIRFSKILANWLEQVVPQSEKPIVPVHPSVP